MTSSTRRPTRPTTRPASSSLGMVDNSIYGVFIKASVKGLIWYNPATLPDIATNGAPKTWRIYDPCHD